VAYAGDPHASGRIEVAVTDTGIGIPNNDDSEERAESLVRRGEESD
jgi:hypothetical protein